MSVTIVAGPRALTLSSRPDHVARRVVFLSCLSSSCLRNSRPMNSTSVSSNGPTEGIHISPRLRVACQCGGCIRRHGTVVYVGSHADTLRSRISQLDQVR